MARHNPTDNANETDGKPPKGNPGLEDSLDKAQKNQGEVRPEDYPEKLEFPSQIKYRNPWVC
jgi:hypothetical protein